MKATYHELKDNIKDLNISIEDLYKAKDKQILIWLSDKDYYFTLILKSNGKPDCKISSFTANIWARTDAGVNYKKYKDTATLQREVKKLIKSKIDTSGDISFSLNNEVHIF
jgi:hypothetical protein